MDNKAIILRKIKTILNFWSKKANRVSQNRKILVDSSIELFLSSISNEELKSNIELKISSNAIQKRRDKVISKFRRFVYDSVNKTDNLSEADIAAKELFNLLVLIKGPVRMNDLLVKKRSSKFNGSQILCKYNISQIQYDTLLRQQHGVCAICKNKQSARDRKGNLKPLFIDHDHKTGKVRGFLCHSCNMGLGSFKDNQEFLVSAMYYLDKNSK